MGSAFRGACFLICDVRIPRPPQKGGEAGHPVLRTKRNLLPVLADTQRRALEEDQVLQVVGKAVQLVRISTVVGLYSKPLSQGEESWKHSSDRRRGKETDATKPEHRRRRRRNVSGDPAADLLIRRQRLPRKIRQPGRGGPSRPYRTQQYTGQIFLSFPHGEELLGRPQQPVFFIAGVEALFE